MKIEITKTPGGIPAISSLEIAKITGKPHGNVMNDIRRILDEAEISQQEFLLSRLDAGGKSHSLNLRGHGLRDARAGEGTVKGPRAALGGL